jgi:hypothetical protein
MPLLKRRGRNYKQVKGGSMSKIMNGITNDRLNELFRHGHLGHPHEVAVMAGELIEHRRCKDCDGVHDGGCVNTSEAEAPVVNSDVQHLRDVLEMAYRHIVNHHSSSVIQSPGAFCPVCHHADNSEPEMDAIVRCLDAYSKPATTKPAKAPVVKLINYHTKECAFWSDCHNGFDHPRACDCGADERKLAATKPIIGEACEHGVPYANECVACGRLAAKKPPLIVDNPPVVDETTGTCVQCGCVVRDSFIQFYSNGKPSCKKCAMTKWDENEAKEVKPAAPVVEPWIYPASLNDMQSAILQLQRRLEAVEKAGRV